MFGMGIKISAAEPRSGEGMGMLESEGMPSEDLIVVDHGSRFAKSLGFYEDADWSLALPSPGAPAPIDESSGEEGEVQRGGAAAADGAAEGEGVSDDEPASHSVAADDEARYRRYSDLMDYDEVGELTVASVVAEGPPAVDAQGSASSDPESDD